MNSSVAGQTILITVQIKDTRRFTFTFISPNTLYTTCYIALHVKWKQNTVLNNKTLGLTNYIQFNSIQFKNLI